jgi:putative membrane protein insertion efficiency factor
LPQARDGAHADTQRGGDRAGVARVAAWVIRAPAECLVGLVRLYQVFLSPILGGQCRFHPSCSEYCIQAIRKYGAVRGGLKGVGRVLRCHPFHRGGFDPP